MLSAGMGEPNQRRLRLERLDVLTCSITSHSHSLKQRSMDSSKGRVSAPLHSVPPVGGGGGLLDTKTSTHLPHYTMNMFDRHHLQQLAATATSLIRSLSVVGRTACSSCAAPRGITYSHPILRLHRAAISLQETLVAVVSGHAHYTLMSSTIMIMIIETLAGRS